MEQKEINEAYKKFNIPETLIPNYSNAEDFSKSFKKCTALKDVNICYASGSNSFEDHSNY